MRYLAPAALMVLAVALYPARGQDPQRRAEVHLGAGSCAAPACHGGQDDARREYKVWATKDKHRKAFDVLAGPAGRRMGARLGIDPTKDASCLSCHATAGVRLNKPHVVEDGVSCEICHGGAKDWLGPHATEDWKALSPAGKEKRGLRDLSTGKKRVASCVGCHVGGPGRQVTHAIMAAGHPPLVFEAQAFLSVMPPHWKDEKDLSLSTWVAGLHASAVAQLRRIEQAFRPGKGLEFAVFDCYSCHHPIYAGSVYEQTAPPGKSGALAFDLAPLKVLLIAHGDKRLLTQFRPALTATWDPRRERRDALSTMAKRAADALAGEFANTDILKDADRQRYLRNLDAHLAAIEAGKARAPRAEMLLLAMSIGSLTGKDLPAELDKALEAATRYDAKRCASLARKLLQ